MKPETYLGKLYAVEHALPHLLANESLWHSLFVDYAKPHVERVFMNWNGLRINLHRISACETHEALFHPHPWPSAMRILEGSYEMGVGYSTTDEVPPAAATLILPAGAAYEMVDRNGWHYVRPLTDYSLTLMVSGEPWDRTSPKSSYTLSELSSEKKREILELFRKKYPAV